jgi:5'-AMP-activated protein kinase catalytic alpha subunit
VVGFHRIPIDRTILEKLKDFNFDIEYAERCIEANKHNHITTAYYLLLKKNLKTGYKSNADLSSIDFDYSSVQPFRRV